MSAERSDDYKLARAYVQALVDRSGYTVAAIDAYADNLANLYWQFDSETRETARAAMEAYIAGWEEGHTDGYTTGRHEGWREFSTRLRRFCKARRQPATR